MFIEKYQTNIDPNNAKPLELTTRMYKLEKNKTSFLETLKGGGGNRTQTRTNNKGGDPKKNYVEVLVNLKSWRINKSKENINIYGKYWW